MKTTLFTISILVAIFSAYWLAIDSILNRNSHIAYSLILVVGINIIAIILIVGIFKHYTNLVERELNEASRKKVSIEERKAWHESKVKTEKLEMVVTELKTKISSIKLTDEERNKVLREFFKDAMKASTSNTTIIDPHNKTETKTISAADAKTVIALVEEYSKLV